MYKTQTAHWHLTSFNIGTLVVLNVYHSLCS